MIRLVIAAKFSVLMMLSASVALGQQRTIAIKAINGKTGKPLDHQRLLVFGGTSEQYAKDESFEATTTADGTATIRIGPDTQWIQVWVDRFALCQDKPNVRAFRVATIAETGDSSPNNCGKVVIKTIPGTFVVYARKPTLLEEMNW